jgi:hypothetical protein
MEMRRRRWSVVVGVVGAGLLGLALLGMTTWAAADEVIYACVANRDGAVRIVGPGGSCNANKETPKQWNVQGPPGVLGSFDNLTGLACTKPGGGVGSVAVIYQGDGVATVACATGRYLDLGLVVFDRQTGLMWEKKTTTVGSGTNPSDLHDVDNTYTWCQATGNASGVCAGNTTSWINQVNAEKFFGYTDWRLPTGVTSVDFDGGELATILLAPLCGTSPCIDPIFAPTASSFYWSATEVGLGDAWGVYFSFGDVTFGGKADGNLVRAVRGGP